MLFGDLFLFCCVWEAKLPLLDFLTALVTYFLWYYHQWPRQRSKRTRSIRSQKILLPGHLDGLFPQKKLTTFFQVSFSKYRLPTPFRHQNKTNKAVRYGNIFIFCSHYYWSKAICRAWARAVDLPARSAPPLTTTAFSYCWLMWELLKLMWCE